MDVFQFLLEREPAGCDLFADPLKPGQDLLRSMSMRLVLAQGQFQQSRYPGWQGLRKAGQHAQRQAVPHDAADHLIVAGVDDIVNIVQAM